MAVAPTPSRISRIDLRFRPQLLDTTPSRQTKQRFAPKVPAERPEPLAMGQGHRHFHRRAAQAATEIQTVQIIASVDPNGNLLGTETATAQNLPLPTVAAAVSVAAPVAPSLLAPAQALPSVLTQAAQVVPAVQPAVTLVAAIPSVAAQAIQDTASLIPSVVAPVVSSVVAPVVSSVVAPVVSSVVAPVVSSVVAPVVSSVVAPVLPVVSLPTVPSVPAFPSDLTVPPVPSQPPFPSNLVVPSVPPFPQSSDAAHAQAASSAVSSPASPPPTSAPGSSAVTTASSIQPSIPSTATPFPSQTSTSLNSALPTSLSATTLLPDLVSTTTSFASEHTTSESAVATSTHEASGKPGNPAGVPGATITATTAAGGGAASNTNSSSAPLQTPQVVGSVVGSLAGAALILAIILLLLRRHKRRRRGALQLTGDDHTDRDQQPMTQAPPSTGLVPATFLNRFSSMSRSTADTSTSAGERSFQRVSGRKLPSAFSEGMTSDQFSRGGTLSGSSFYQDEHGTYGDPGLAKEIGTEFDKEIGNTSTFRGSGPMNFRPSPARTPVIRHPDDAPPFGASRSHLSPPQSPNADLAGRPSLGRSLQSADGSRASRFSENV